MGLINKHGEIFVKAPGNATKKSPCARSLCPLGHLCHRTGLICFGEEAQRVCTLKMRGSFTC
eukprot:6117734-Amphidinium_carterae.1